VIAVAALSARMLVEAAAGDGEPALALDVFGDVDTCRAAPQWLAIGEPGALRIDGARLLAALASLAQREEVRGWVAGSGFEGRVDLLEAGAALLPLLGTAPADVRRLRDPRAFFAALDRHRIAHPETRFDAPPQPAGWLLKDGDSCGGWQVRRAGEGEGADGAASGYWQREVEGAAMSATFVANGREAVVLGCNLQLSRGVGSRPFVVAGVIGPLPVRAAIEREVDAAVQRLAAEFALRGLGSLDFIADGERALVLEVNPRPPASLALYPRIGSGGPWRAHLRACAEGELPPGPSSTPALRGHEIVFARRTLRLDAAAAARIAASGDTHDLPREGQAFAAGEPLCSVDAEAADPAAVRAALARRRDALLEELETIR